MIYRGSKTIHAVLYNQNHSKLQNTVRPFSFIWIKVTIQPLSNENTNGLIRQYFKKGTSFENLTDKDIERVQNIVNNRPGKKLGFLTPIEFYLTTFTNQKVAFAA